MYDDTGAVIYVGKAKKLKNRVSSYFHGEHLPKVAAMVEKVSDFNVMVVKSEFEALVLENSLIKKYQPHYNILLKDDKGYPFIRLDMSKEFPRFELVSKMAKDGAKYYGPFGGRGLTKDIINEVCHTLRLPDCQYAFPRDRACLNRQIGLCDGWCVKGDRDEYLRRIDQADYILSGRIDELVAILEKKMTEAADELRFEYAASIRDRIRSIEGLRNRERVTSGWAERNIELRETDDDEALAKKGMKTLEMLGEMLELPDTPHLIEAFDVSNLGDTGIVAAMTAHKDGKAWKKGYRKFRIRDLDIRDDYASMYQAVYRRFSRYAEGDEKFSYLPDLLLIDGGDTHAAMAEKALADLGIDVPVFGMVKDSRHRTRALVNSKGEEIGISSFQNIFVLIGRIQEETHRFAIEYQRSLRYENMGSELDSIPGVGEKRKADLLKHFKTVKAVREASFVELCEAVPKNTAEAVIKYYESNNGNGKGTETEDP